MTIVTLKIKVMFLLSTGIQKELWASCLPSFKRIAVKLVEILHRTDVDRQTDGQQDGQMDGQTARHRQAENHTLFMLIPDFAQH